MKLLKVERGVHVPQCSIAGDVTDCDHIHVVVVQHSVLVLVAVDVVSVLVLLTVGDTV